MKRIYTLPNLLSIMRLIMIPVIVVLILRSNDVLFPFMIFCFFFAILLDFLDGFLARILAQESEFGKILDPVADKLLVISLLVALVLKTDFPRWLALLIISRDAVILFASVLLYSGKRVVKASLPAGKVTFALLSMMLLTYLIDLNENINLDIVKDFLTPLCFVFLIWSGIEYFQVFMSEERE